MTAIIEEITLHVPADAWAGFTPGAAPGGEELDYLIGQYLAQGGTITELDPAATADDSLSGFKRSIIATSRFTAAEHIAHTERTRNQYTARARKRDERLVVHMDLLLEHHTTRKQLNRDLGISDSLTGRLLETYFSNDPRAYYLIDVYDRNEKAVLARIREAIDSGLVGVAAIAKACNIGTTRLNRMSKQHRITIPRGLHGWAARKAAQAQGELA